MEKKKKYFLTIDRGQTGIKAGFCDIRADIIATASCKCQPIQCRKDGWAEQDMELIWEQTVTVIHQLFLNSGIHPAEIAAVSFAGQGGGNFLVSEDGTAVYPGVLSLDNRHEEALERISGLDNIEIPRTIAFMLWLKEQEPEIFVKTRWIMGSKDWIRYRMTGTANVDMSDPPAPVDLDTGMYQTEILESAGIQECIKMLPPLVYASEICGMVTETAARDTGLLEGTPVVAGAHDMIACSVGAGGNYQGHLTIIMGTMGINIAVLDRNKKPIKDVRSGECFLFGGVTAEHRTVTTSIGSACNTMNWFLDMLFEQEKEEAEKRGIDIFELLEEKLAVKEVSNVLFQPYLLGAFYNSSARAGFLGISAKTTREDLLMALFQGICIAMCIEIQKLEDKIQIFERIWMVGGGSRSHIWGQMFADVLKRPVYICKDDETGLRGAAVCAGIALGYYTWKEGFPEPEIKTTYYPDPERSVVYEKQLEVYTQTYKMSVGFWNQQKDM